MKRNRVWLAGIAAGAIVMFCSVGCRTSARPAATSSDTRLAVASALARNSEARSQGRDAAMLPSPEEIVDRGRRIQELEATVATTFAAFHDRLEVLSGTADEYGSRRFWLGAAGFGAGLGAAALTVASPANAVWIAALSGFAGGVAGLNTLQNDLGFSKGQVVALQADVLDRFSRKYAEINVPGLYEVLDQPVEVWAPRWDAQQKLVNDLRVIVLSTYIPTIGTRDGP